MRQMPILETARLWIRPFELADLNAAYRLFDVELSEAGMGSDAVGTIAERAEWLQWATRNPRQLARLNQPPYGDRAIIVKNNETLIGSCGFVPALNAFEQIPELAANRSPARPGRNSTEFALFYAVSPAYQRQGYAYEAAQAMVQYAFEQLSVNRVIAETDTTNEGSIAVMRKLGMTIYHNPLPDPPWLQVVGVLENWR